MFVEYDRNGKGTAYTQKQDQCYTCEDATQCVLYLALNEGVILLNFDEIDIKNCKQYKNANKLKVVK